MTALLSELSAAEVKFLVVGAYAMAWYGLPRGTKDLDLWVEPSLANAEHVMHALAQFGAPLAHVTVDDFARPGAVYQIGKDPVRADVLTELTGLDFGAAWQRRQAGELGGVAVQYLGREDFLINKRAVARPQDLVDAARLEQAISRT
ncbi:MAG: nucleotidyltransferase [Terriglobales bacterium]